MQGTSEERLIIAQALQTLDFVLDDSIVCSRPADITGGHISSADFLQPKQIRESDPAITVSNTSINAMIGTVNIICASRVGEGSEDERFSREITQMNSSWLCSQNYQ
jgi:hypothetical protein